MSNKVSGGDKSSELFVYPQQKLGTVLEQTNGKNAIYQRSLIKNLLICNNGGNVSN